MKIAVVGSTGLVGGEVLRVLEEFNLKVDKLIPVASQRSVGNSINFEGDSIKVVNIEDAIAMRPNIAIFSAGGQASLDYAPKFVEIGTTVIDNSSAWRMKSKIKLVVPEINGSTLTRADKIIANPNCSTIQMVLALRDLHHQYKLKRIVISTYQSVTGTGKAAVDQLMAEREGREVKMAYPYQIDLNAIPQIDLFLESGYTKEEMKIVKETKKIFDDDSIQVTATAVPPLRLSEYL